MSSIYGFDMLFGSVNMILSPKLMLPTVFLPDEFDFYLLNLFEFLELVDDKRLISFTSALLLSDYRPDVSLYEIELLS